VPHFFLSCWQIKRCRENKNLCPQLQCTIIKSKLYMRKYFLAQIKCTWSLKSILNCNYVRHSRYKTLHTYTRKTVVTSVSKLFSRVISTVTAAKKPQQHVIRPFDVLTCDFREPIIQNISHKHKQTCMKTLVYKHRWELLNRLFLNSMHMK
jgi:hypothetical protein